MEELINSFDKFRVENKHTLFQYNEFINNYSDKFLFPIDPNKYPYYYVGNFTDIQDEEKYIELFNLISGYLKEKGIRTNNIIDRVILKNNIYYLKVSLIYTDINFYKSDMLISLLALFGFNNDNRFITNAKDNPKYGDTVNLIFIKINDNLNSHLLSYPWITGKYIEDVENYINKTNLKYKHLYYNRLIILKHNIRNSILHFI